MNSLYLAQHLLNDGVLTADDVRALLPKCEAAEPCDEILAAAQEKKATESTKFAQALVDEGRLVMADALDLIEKYSAEDADAHPVATAVGKLADESIDYELPSYCEFCEIFLRSFIRFMDTSAVVSVEPPIFGDVSDTHIVTQKLSGDLTFVTGMFTSDDMFVEMAKRYSHEDIEEVDELAIDSLQEFLNVINGLFAVDMAKQQRDIDLDAPQVIANSMPGGSNTLKVEVISGIGDFVLMTATDEIAFREFME